MLVLTRKNGEELVITGGIIISVVQASNGRVKLGITAPRDIEVRRRELDNEGPPDQPTPTPTPILTASH